MSYLQRVSRRAVAQNTQSAAITKQSIVGRPAVASRSPLAEIDQRLHLDPFSDILDSTDSARTSVDYHEYSTEEVVKYDAGKNPNLNSQTVPANPGSEVSSENQDHPAAKPASQNQGNQSSTKSNTVQRDASSVSNLPIHLQPSISASTPTRTRGPQSSGERVVDSKHSLQQNDTQPLPLAADSQSGSRPATQQATGAVLRRSISESISPDNPQSASLRNKLLAAQRWIETGTGTQSRSQAKAQASASAGSPGVDNSIAPGQGPAAATAKPGSVHMGADQRPRNMTGQQSITRVEIGTIDVEVVAPVATSASRTPTARNSPQQRRSGVSPPFGWRQR